MPDRRELSRRKARERRAIAKEEALIRARNNSELALKALQQASCLVAEPTLKSFLLSRDIQSVPQCLTSVAGQRSDLHFLRGNSAQGTLEQISLQFAVAWKFLYPLLADAEVRAYLDSSHPSFIPELKDAFIALVVDGPFPNAMSGHRGRKHHGNYNGQS